VIPTSALQMDDKTSHMQEYDKSLQPHANAGLSQGKGFQIHEN
jgi:hypothetical protein